MMKNTAQLAMIDLSPEEEKQLSADFEQMTAFGERLSQLVLDEEGEKE